MTRKVIGSIVNTVGFEIDKTSWKNLNKFQERIRGLKKDMKGLSGGISIKGSGGFGGRGNANPITRIKKESDAHVAAYHKVLNMKKKAQTKAIIEERKRTRASGAASRKEIASDHIKALSENIRRKKAIAKRSETADLRDVASSDVLTGMKGKLTPAAIQSKKKQLDGLSEAYRKGTISKAHYSQMSNRVVAGMRKEARAAGGLSSKFMDLRRNMLGIGIAGTVLAGASGLMRTGQNFESMGAKMLMATGGAKQAAEAMDLARKQSKRLGLDLLSTADSLARLGIAADQKLTKGEFKELFISFSELGAAAQLPKEQMDRGLRALEQMLNKGQLMAEEVKGQFSEAIPGGIRIFADALGMSEQAFFKAMEAGKLMSKDVLPKVAKQMAITARKGGALSTAMDTNRASMNRMITAFQTFQKKIFDAGFSKVLTELFNTFTDLFTVLGPLATTTMAALTTAFQVFTFPLRIAAALIADFMAFFGMDEQNNVSKMTGIFIGFAGGIYILVKAIQALAKAKLVLMAIASPGKALAGIAAVAAIYGGEAAYNYYSDRNKASQKGSSMKANSKQEVFVRLEGDMDKLDGFVKYKISNNNDAIAKELLTNIPR
jgi:tape measure domain-containing protein